jgi:mono/diheme cytochrome c family protein
MSVRRPAGRLVGVLIGVAIAASAGAQPPAIERGKATFQHTCAPCHGTGPGDDGRAMLPGTDALRIKYGGKIPPALEHRTDLTTDTIRAFVRNGTFSMPPFRKTELTDVEIADIAAYIADSARRGLPGTPR